MKLTQENNTKQYKFVGLDNQTILIFIKCFEYNYLQNKIDSASRWGIVSLWSTNYYRYKTVWFIWHIASCNRQRNWVHLSNKNGKALAPLEKHSSLLADYIKEKKNSPLRQVHHSNRFKSLFYHAHTTQVNLIGHFVLIKASSTLSICFESENPLHH